MAIIVINSRFLTQKTTGVQRFATELSKELKKMDLSIIFVAPNNIICKELADYFNVQRFGRFSSHLWEQIELPIYLRKLNNPLLLNFSGLGPIFYKNKIMTIHDLSFLSHPEWFSRRYFFFYKIMTRISIKYSKYILTVSEFSKNEIMTTFCVSKDKIKKIYNAISWNIKNHKTNYKSKYILTVSSLDPRKNLDNLINAFNIINLENYKLVIVGERNKIFRKTNLFFSPLKNVVFTGFVSDEELKKLYNNATLFIYPSLYEGFGIPPLEAMSMGCPTIVSETTSLPEVCGNASIYINPRDIRDIADSILMVLGNRKLQQSMIAEGYKNIKRFNWKESAIKLCQVINKLNI